MITHTTNDVAILLVATGIKSLVTLPDMTVYMPGKSTSASQTGNVEENTVYQIRNGFVTEAKLTCPIALLKDSSGQIDELYNYRTGQKGWFNSELTGIDWE